EDARSLQSIPNDWADLIITSPPYANNFDYADATRLEMSFMGEVNGWGDIHKAVRQHLICSCTQHVPYVGKVSGLLQDKNLDPIRAAITSVCEQLGSEKETHGGKKAYDGMIAAYFSDMAMVWHALRRICRPDALVCFVIGDSAPYGVYVPVDQWLGELAIASGFKSYTFEKTRDRNIKWKNRKHQVPLHEGRLWVQG
ncbi:MAG: DNA modification methylase, partial [Chloroflexi bacterium]|nr:DNA modification methylase [Chloroflexota bacterium]